jgi:hypothetical protein
MSADFPSHDPNGQRPAPELELQEYPNVLPPLPPPTAAAPLVEAPPAEVVERVRRSPAVTKLRILLRCHDVAAGARNARTFGRAAKAVGVVLIGLVLGGLAGLGVFAAIYDNPEREAQRYTNDGWSYTYYVKGEKVSQQQYDYYLATNSNFATAMTAAVAAGLVVLTLFVAPLWLRGRKAESAPAGGVDEQIAAIVRDHPEAVREWGGPSVLREPELVREILRIEEKGGR